MKAIIRYAKNFKSQVDVLNEFETVAELPIHFDLYGDDSVIDLCEKLYRAFNAVSGDEIVMPLERRSMSIGDMIEFVWEPAKYDSNVPHSETYFVDLVGFRKVMTPNGGWNA